MQAKILPGPDAPGIEIRYRRVEKSGSRLEKELKMTRHLDRNLYGTAGLHQENAFSATTYTWKEVFGDVEDENLVSGQACKLNLARFQAPEVDADEFEAVYLWFLA
jgi:hypothetical protein